MNITMNIIMTIIMNILMNIIIRRRRTALSGFCPDLLCGVCQSKAEIFSREVFRVSGFRI